MARHAEARRPQVEIYTDGACSGNPGPGGWGAVLMYGSHTKEICGGEAGTTNNRMGLMAAIKGLESLNRPATGLRHTRNSYPRARITSLLPERTRTAGGPARHERAWQSRTC